MNTEAMKLIVCPESSCGALAEVVDEFRLSSTDGTIAYSKTQCLGGHWFTVPTEGLTPMEIDIKMTRPALG